MASLTNSNQSKPVERLGDKTANQIRLKSFLDGPICQLSELQRSLLLAEAALVAYLPIQECKTAAAQLGFADNRLFEGNGAQAHWFQSDHDSVIVFRGVEPVRWSDIYADAAAPATLSETVGKVHHGFKSQVDAVWPEIESTLVEHNDKTLWFSGHSLGGAMATICAERCLVSYVRSEPEELHTFGSPRVGSTQYVKSSRTRHYRWVNNHDAVTRVPPLWMGYRHAGDERHVDRFGHLKNVKIWERFSVEAQDLIKHVWQGRRKIRNDSLAGHSIVEYIEKIFDMLRAQGAGAAKAAS